MPAATIRADMDAGAAAACEVRLQDFSVGGLRAESPVRFKQNERLTLRVASRDRHPPLELTGRVVHCRRAHDRYCVGIEFCHSTSGLATSPWRQLPRLFSLAYTAEPGAALPS